MTISCCRRPPQLHYSPLQIEVSLSHCFIQSFTHSAFIHSSSCNTQTYPPNLPETILSRTWTSSLRVRNQPFHVRAFSLLPTEKDNNNSVWRYNNTQIISIPSAPIQGLMHPMIFSSLVQWQPKLWGLLLFVVFVLTPFVASNLKENTYISYDTVSKCSWFSSWQLQSALQSLLEQCISQHLFLSFWTLLKYSNTLSCLEPWNVNKPIESTV